MTKTASFKRLGYFLLRSITIVFLAIGYFIGFSIVSICSIGLCSSEEFEVLMHDQEQRHRFPIFNQHGQYFLQAHYVSMIGWTLLTTIWMIAIA